MKKMLVTKEWRKMAMAAIEDRNKNNAFVNGLEMFLNTALEPEQQKSLESEIGKWADNYIGMDL